jgi:hypothetical protein
MYTYIVASVVKGEDFHIISWPILGVYTSLSKALRHYNDVMDERMRRGFVVNYRRCCHDLYKGDKETANPFENGERQLRMFESCMEEKGGQLEYLYLEKWRNK